MNSLCHGMDVLFCQNEPVRSQLEGKTAGKWFLLLRLTVAGSEIHQNINWSKYVADLVFLSQLC